MSDCDPVGVPELAERLGVAATTPHQWKSRGLMPPPDYVVSTTPAWEWCGVLRWAGLNGRIYNPAAVAEYRDRFGEDPVRPRLGGPSAPAPEPEPKVKAKRRRNASIGRPR